MDYVQKVLISMEEFLWRSLFHHRYPQGLPVSKIWVKLRRKTDEFIQITSHMQEGLVVLDRETNIRSDGKLLGAVILAVDVTEAQNAEKLRREFSANVSHELKPPLQGIIGSAELLESGMVRAADTPRFVGHIRREAARLVNLIEDIIRLSQLDEDAAMPTETVDLLPLAQEVKTLLQPSAQERDFPSQASAECSMR